MKIDLFFLPFSFNRNLGLAEEKGRPNFPPDAFFAPYGPANRKEEAFGGRTSALDHSHYGRDERKKKMEGKKRGRKVVRRRFSKLCGPNASLQGGKGSKGKLAEFASGQGGRKERKRKGCAARRGKKSRSPDTFPFAAATDGGAG